MEWLSYLTVISRKPRFLFNSGIYDMMPENMKQYMKSCGSTDRGAILKVLAELTVRGKVILQPQGKEFFT